jgi:hypothetical protein
VIEAKDVDFHPPIADEPEWAEVISCGFSIPERDLNVRIYLLFRSQFGVAQSSITMISSDALHPWQADYADFRPHLPGPTSLRDFELRNGLSFETITPHQSWRLAFDDGEDTAFDVRFDALMKPYSPFEPNDNPLATGRPAMVDHFEQSGRYTGWLKLRGELFQVDSIRMMNHGWGPRRDRNYHGPTGSQGRTWLHAHFADGYAVFGMWSFHLDRPDALSLIYGYVLSNGNVIGLVGGEARVSHDADRYPVVVEIEVRDHAGTVHHLASEPVHRAIWSSWPNMTTFCVFARWRSDGHGEGFGDVLEFTEIASLTLHNAREKSQNHDFEVSHQPAVR